MHLVTASHPLLTLKSSPTFRGGTIYTLILLILILFCGLREPMLYPDMGNYRSFFFTGEMDAESMLSSTKKDDIEKVEDEKEERLTKSLVRITRSI